MKNVLPIVVVLIVGAAIFYFFPQFSKEAQNVTGTDYKNISYSIGGETVVLKNGTAETEIAPGSASKLVTRYFGNEVKGDFNRDGFPDVAFLLTQDGGGSGTFFYVATALGTVGGYRGTDAVFLGDRIAPQTTEFQNGELVVNYADRRIDEAYTAPPTVGISKYFTVNDSTLVEILK